MLHKLGVPVLQQSLLPHGFSYRCLKPRALQVAHPRAVVAHLADIRVDLCWGDLREQDMRALLSFVQQGKLDSHALEQLQHLPVFQKFGGVLCSCGSPLQGAVAPQTVPGSALGAQALYDLDNDTVLLTPSPIHEWLAEGLKWKFIDDQKLFTNVVVPWLSQLTRQNLMEAIHLFFILQPICDTQSVEAIVAAFQKVAFTPDAHGTLRLASYFYHDMSSFCTLCLQNRFVPESFFKELRSNWKAVNFFLKAGVHTSLSVEDF